MGYRVHTVPPEPPANIEGNLTRNAPKRLDNVCLGAVFDLFMIYDHFETISDVSDEVPIDLHCISSQKPSF